MKRAILLAAALSLACACFGAQQPASADDLLAQARVTYDGQGPKPALPQFEAALAAYRASGDRRGEAVTIGLIGNCYKHLGDLPRALDLLQSSLAIKRELKDPIEQAKTLNNIGLLYWEQGKLANAVESYTSAIKLSGDAGNRQIEAAVLNNLGLAHSASGDYKQAFDEYQRALAAARSAGFDRATSDALGNLGGWYMDLGHYSDALNMYQESSAVAEKAGLKPSLMQNIGNTGLIYTALGRVQDALEAFDKAAALAADQGLQREEADWHKGKGSALAQIGQYDQALEQFRRAAEMYNNSGAARQHTEVLNDLADLYLSMGDVVAAEKEFGNALAAAQKAGYAQDAESAALSLAAIEQRRGQLAKAKARMEEVLKRARAGGDDAVVADILIRLAALDRAQHRFAAAQDLASEAARVAHTIGAPILEARAVLEDGESLLAAGKSADALARFLDAKALSTALADSELAWNVRYAEGRARESLHDFDAAVLAYRSAVEQIESVRDQLHEERYRSGYLQDRFEVYVALVRLLVKLHRFDEALSYSEQLRARSFLELSPVAGSGSQRELAELRARIRRLAAALESEQSNADRRSAQVTFADELNAAEKRYQELIDDLRVRNPEWSLEHGLTVSSAENISRAVPRGAALLEFVVGPASTSLLCVSGGRVDGILLPVRERDLTAKIELLRDLISEPDRDDWRGPAASLYRQLIAPAARAGWLNGVRRLYIVPHGPLHYLPFAVLLDGSDTSQRFLVQQYSIKELVSASLLSDQREPVNSGPVLSIAPARAHLPYAAQEARAVAQLFPSSSLALTGTAPTKQRVERIAGKYSVLHLATHGYFDRLNPMFSGVQLQPDGGDDGTLRVYEILGLHLHARLVTLSGCETALGSGFFSNLPPGDEFVSLMRAFLAAGGESVMATLWDVNDRSTAKFMVNFYRHASREDSASALADAQRTMASGGAFEHPYYWAAFVVSGTGK